MHSILFSDIDGTLLHANNGPGTVAVEPVRSKEHHFSVRAAELIEQYRAAGNLFVLSTARRSSGCAGLVSLLQPDYVITEHGCLVLRGGEPDEGWQQVFAATVGVYGVKQGPLWEIEAALQKAGYNTDSNGRYASFRVFRDNPTFLSDPERAELEARVSELGAAQGITTIRHQQMLDVLPANGGKVSAIRYLLETTGIPHTRSRAIGDNTNDTEMLAYSAWAGCQGHAPESVKAVVRERGGYITPFTSHQGTEDLLEHACRKIL